MDGSSEFGDWELLPSGGGGSGCSGSPRGFVGVGEGGIGCDYFEVDGGEGLLDAGELEKPRPVQSEAEGKRDGGCVWSLKPDDWIGGSREEGEVSDGRLSGRRWGDERRGEVYTETGTVDGVESEKENEEEMPSSEKTGEKSAVDSNCIGGDVREEVGFSGTVVGDGAGELGSAGVEYSGNESAEISGYRGDHFKVEVDFEGTGFIDGIEGENQGIIEMVGLAEPEYEGDRSAGTSNSGGDDPNEEVGLEARNDRAENQGSEESDLAEPEYLGDRSAETSDSRGDDANEVGLEAMKDEAEDLGSAESGDSVEKSHDERNLGVISVRHGENAAIFWWKAPFELLKFCVFKVRPIWPLSVAAAVMGFVLLGRRLHNLRRKCHILNLKINIDEKKASQFVSRAAHLNEAFSIVKRSPFMKAPLPPPGLSPWSAIALR